MTDAFELPAWAGRLLALLEMHGETWVVGGWVRDSLLGREPGDVDIACSLPVAQTASILEKAGQTIIPVGMAHGTVATLFEGNLVEITSFRRDGAYSDGRHPDTVMPASGIEEDLARRDFTVNSMAWHPERGLKDPFGGQADLMAGVIRCTGEPALRLKEDALRILRALRFAAKLDFSIEPETASALHYLSPDIAKLSRERIFAELDGLLCTPSPGWILLEYGDVIGTVIPEVIPCITCPQTTKYHIYDVWEHICHTVDASPARRTVRWAAMLHDIGKPETHFQTDGVSHFYGHAKAGEAISRRVAADLRFPRSLADTVPLLVRHHDDPVAADRKAINRMIGRLGGNPDAFMDLCDLKVADALAHAPEYRGRAEQAVQLKEFLAEMLAQHEPFAIKDLAVNGKDLMELGFTPGPGMGAALKALFEAVRDGKLPNERAALIAAAAQLR
ncbi:MAG: CCA tRNA nucleotidyltransferase [Eggerthellaceae bacterium]|nr:CCA tRNA nucleotidyltransferase [Eggerthellaceae bacterium]